MENIIILGSQGKVGLHLKNYLKKDNKLFLDEDIDIENILTLDFLNKNKIKCIINCIGSTNNEQLFFSSNFLLPSSISEKLKEIDLNLKQKLIFIHISSIGVTAPYMKYNFREISIKPFQKDKIKYNFYEFSKSCAEYNIRNNLKISKNINTIIFQPSNIIFNNSNFLKKLKIFLIISPLKLEGQSKLAITPIDYLLKTIYKFIKNSNQSTFSVKKVYKKEKINLLINNYFFISFFKIKIPFFILKKIIESLPEKYFLYRLKKFLIHIYIL